MISRQTICNFTGVKCRFPNSKENDIQIFTIRNTGFVYIQIQSILDFVQILFCTLFSVCNFESKSTKSDIDNYFYNYYIFMLNQKLVTSYSYLLKFDFVHWKNNKSYKIVYKKIIKIIIFFENLDLLSIILVKAHYPLCGFAI